MNMKLFAKVGLLLLVIGCASVSLHASEATIVVGGTITQSDAQGTGPAVNNLSLNNISYGDTYSVTINLAGTITPSASPVTYDLTGAAFTDTTPGVTASETNFDLSNTLTGLTVTPAGGGFDVVSLLVCLTTGIDSCSANDNQLALYFTIPASSLNGTSVGDLSVPSITPMDLLEDDGTTDIHGTVTSYSYQTVGVTPEPASFVLCGSGLLALAIMGLMRKQSRAGKF
jgi:hypothetical protein